MGAESETGLGPGPLGEHTKEHGSRRQLHNPLEYLILGRSAESTLFSFNL